jgi:hypothetical protein
LLTLDNLLKIHKSSLLSSVFCIHKLFFPEYVRHHGLDIRSGFFAGKAFAHMGGGFAFNELQAVGVACKLGEPLRILV